MFDEAKADTRKRQAASCDSPLARRRKQAEETNEADVLRDLRVLRDEMLADFKLLVPDVLVFLELQKKLAETLRNLGGPAARTASDVPDSYARACLAYDRAREAAGVGTWGPCWYANPNNPNDSFPSREDWFAMQRNEYHAALERRQVLRRSILCSDISTPYTKGLKTKLAAHLPRFSSDLVKLVYDMIVPVSFVQHPLFYEPGLFRVLQASYRDDDRTRNTSSHGVPDREKSHFEKPVALDETSLAFSRDCYPPRSAALQWNPDSVLHWAMRIGSEFKPGPYHAEKVLERTFHDLKSHWGLSCYRRTLAALLFCQETLGIVSEDVWVVLPLQKAYFLSVSGSVGTPDMEKNMMNVMRCPQ